MKKKYALISIYNKKNINILCEIFSKKNIEILSTKSTTEYIKSIGYKCHSIEKKTMFKQILDGRVKTLHHKIHGSLLFKRENKKHIEEFKRLNFPKIDFLVVNLYPFEEFIKSNNNNQIIEMIDIGGISLIRSAAKNFKSVTTICDIEDYKELAKNIIKNKGSTSLSFRKKMAAKAFETSSKYDLLISNWLKNKEICNERKNLRYGENPHQKAHLLKNNKKSIYNNVIKEGKPLSYNNILDVESAIDIISEFNEPTCLIIKHNNPCGVCSTSNIKTAFKEALNCDKVSAFGGILAFNRKVEEDLSKEICSNFFEIIIAPSFSEKSKKILNEKKNLILIKIQEKVSKQKIEIRSINNDYLYQEKNIVKIDLKSIKKVSKIKASKLILQDLIFGLKVCKHVKSNSIVLVKNKKTISICGGQTSRIDATKIALSKLSKIQKKAGFVAASDAFFPFVDNIKELSKCNCLAIIQPSGSINDKKIIQFVDKVKLSLYHSKYRFFKH